MVKRSSAKAPQSALPFALLVAFGAAAAAVAGTRTSTDYTLSPETSDSGGQHATSTAYTNDGSIGQVVGVATVGSPSETAKSGYIGQLYEVAALQLTASPTTVNETQTRQLIASQLLDDGSGIVLDSSSLSWSIVSGPLTGVSSSGLITADVVYQNTIASVQGSYAGTTGSLNLTVLDAIADNYRQYAGDTLNDAWQVQHFGQPPNPLAAPAQDPDGDGQSNSFEAVAGLVPTDASSRLVLRVEPVPGQPTQKRIVFSPRYPDRSYAVVASTTLTPGSFGSLGNSVTSDNGTERTVTDLDAGETKKFYQLEIQAP